MSVFRAVMTAAFVAVCCASLEVCAQQPGFSTSIEGGRGLMYMQSARTYGKGKLVVGLKSLVMNKESLVYENEGSPPVKRTDFPSIMALPISFGLTDEIDLNVAVFGFRDSRSLITENDVRLGYGDVEQGMGATRFGVKIRLPRRPDSRFQIAGKFGALFDTSQNQQEGMNYSWTRTGTDIEASLYETIDITSFLSLNLEEGYVLSGSNIYDDQIIGAMGLQFTVKNRCNINLELNNRTFLGVAPLSVFQAGNNAGAFESVNGVPGVGNPSLLRDSNPDLMEDFLIFSPSIALRLTDNITLNLGANYNIADQVEPKETLQVVIGITFNRIFKSLIDSDEDGVTDDRDREPSTPHSYPVDKDGVSLDTDLDGVPDPADKEADTPLGARTNAAGIGIDSDGDSVYDGIDLEPSTPAGARVNKFGVALDGDRDGVPDIHDTERNTPLGAVVDATGKALDGDSDGVPNGLDMEPESRFGALVDESGVSLDGDSDGVPDGLDEEPDTPRGILVDKRGRGLVKTEVSLLREGLIRLTTVQFKPGSTDLNPGSFASLDEIGSLLVKHGELMVQIGGHTDRTGDRQTNLKLSRDRAAAVRDYLFMSFPDIEKSRLRAVGFGPDKPIASNATSAGRQNNRRVEFVIINRDESINK